MPSTLRSVSISGLEVLVSWMSSTSGGPGGRGSCSGGSAWHSAGSGSLHNAHPDHGGLLDVGVHSLEDLEEGASTLEALEDQYRIL